MGLEIKSKTPTQARPSRWNRRVLWLWICLGLLWLLTMGGPRNFARSITTLNHSHRESPAIDLYQDWAAARNHLLGDSIYAPLGKHHDKHKMDIGLALVEDQPTLQFNGHPPTATLLVLPLARLEFRTVFIVWSLGGLLVLILSIHMVLRELWREHSAMRHSLLVIVLTLTLLAAFPVSHQFEFGNVHMLLLGLIVGAWAADRRGHHVLAGSLVGIAAGLKLYPIFLVIYFLILRRWSGALAAVVAFCSLLLCAGMIFGFGCYTEFVETAMPFIRSFRSNPANLSLTGLWYKLFDPGTHVTTAPLWAAPVLAQSLIAMGFVALTGAFVVAGRRLQRSEPRDQDTDLLFSLGVLSMMLLSPVMWPHGHVLLLVPGAVLAKRLPRTQPSFQAFAASLLVVAVSAQMLI